MASVSVEPAAMLGTGPARVIAVPGWMGDHRLFEPMLRFAELERYCFAVLNPRGYGDRLGDEGPYSVSQIAMDIVHCADGLGWKSFSVVGHSMAGMAVQRLLIDVPERIDTAVLIAPVPASGAKIGDERRQLLLEAVHSGNARKLLIDTNTGRTKSEAWLATLRDVSMAGTRPDVLETYMASWSGPGFEREFRPSDVPVRVLVGQLDPGADPQLLTDLLGASFSDVEVSTLSGCGHYPMWEMPDACMRILASWIS